ncbi:hypothetical protein ACHWQZ_G005217 [Mnemiopsis leidyi]
MDQKCKFAQKKNRRSVLNSARANRPNVDETNNYQLAEALAKTRVELSKVHKEKFLYVSQNLKFIETITQLKDENKKLSARLEERELELQNIKNQLQGHKSSIQQLNRSFDDLQVTVNGAITPTTSVILSPPSLVSSFDSGLNSSSINSSSERHEGFIEIAPLAVKQLLSPEFIESGITDPSSDPDKENSDTPRIPKQTQIDQPPQRGNRRPKRKYPEFYLQENLSDELNSPPVEILLETPQINNKKTAFPKKRETPSRSAKSAVKSLLEPKLGSKLRQGDPNTDPFFLKT